MYSLPVLWVQLWWWWSWPQLQWRRHQGESQGWGFSWSGRGGTLHCSQLTSHQSEPQTWGLQNIASVANLSHCLEIDFISGSNYNMYVKQVHELCPLTLRYEVTTQQWIQDRLYSIHFLYDQSFPKPDSQFQGCCKVGILKEGKAHHSESSDCYYMKKQFWFWQNLFLFKWNTRTRYFLFNWNRITGILTVYIYTNSC